jgi:hypothetical protein
MAESVLRGRGKVRSGQGTIARRVLGSNTGDRITIKLIHALTKRLSLRSGLGSCCTKRCDGAGSRRKDQLPQLAERRVGAAVDRGISVAATHEIAGSRRCAGWRGSSGRPDSPHARRGMGCADQRVFPFISCGPKFDLAPNLLSPLGTPSGRRSCYCAKNSIGQDVFGHRTRERAED